MNYACVFLALVVHGDLPSQEKTWTRLTPTEEELAALKCDLWYGIYFAGKKAGFARYYFGSVGAGEGQTYIVTFDMELFNGEDVETSMKQRMEFDGLAPFALRRWIETKADNDEETHLVIAKDGAGYRVRRESGEDEESRPLDDFDYTLSDDMAVDLWLLRNSPVAGEEITVADFDTDLLVMQPMKHRVRGIKAMVRDGVSAEIIELESFLPEVRIPLLCRYDAKAKQLISAQFGAMIELRIEPEDVAKNLDIGADLFKLGTVKVNRRLGDLTTARQLVLDATMTKGAKIPSGPGQAVAEASSDLLRITLTPGGSMTAATHEIDENLRRTESYPTDHDSIRILAARAVGDATTPVEKVKRILAFVHGYIDPSYTAEPINVHSLIQMRSGDCSEYAALFTTLARSAGIPCREVSGLLCFGGDDREFSPHAWNEVALHGRWVAVDASQNQFHLDVGHLKLGNDDGTEIDAMFSIQKLKLIEIEKRE